MYKHFIISIVFGLLFLLPNTVFAQLLHRPDELFGFRVGQYKSVVSNELGQPAATQLLDDSTLIDFYYISSDSASFLAFQYLPHNPDEVYAIQVSGTTPMSRNFYGTNLGDTENKLIAAFGKPEAIENQTFNQENTSNYAYHKQSFSLLFSDNQLQSIRIWTREEAPVGDAPKLSEILSIIKSNDKRKIADLLSPTLEVFQCDNVLTWKNSIYRDIYEEKASVFDFIINEQFGVKSLAKNKKIKHEMNLRLIQGAGVFPVYKFGKASLIEEIVLKYEQGRYKIFEIKYRCTDK